VDVVAPAGVLLPVVMVVAPLALVAGAPPPLPPPHAASKILRIPVVVFDPNCCHMDFAFISKSRKAP
jgi:hypothetical protein